MKTLFSGFSFSIIVSLTPLSPEVYLISADLSSDVYTAFTGELLTDSYTVSTFSFFISGDTFCALRFSKVSLLSVTFHDTKNAVFL